jgi:lipopolysaccharide export system protein LptA
MSDSYLSFQLNIYEIVERKEKEEIEEIEKNIEKIKLEKKDNKKYEYEGITKKIEWNEKTKEYLLEKTKEFTIKAGI